MEEQQQMEVQDGITLSSILELFKKGWKRLLIVVLISLVIATSLLVILREGLSFTEYKTQIRFSPESMREETILNPSTYVDEIVRQDNIIREALTACGISQEKQDDMLKNNFKENISTNVLETYKMSATQEYPYIVEISLKKSKDFGLSKSQYSSISSELTKATLNYLKEKFEYTMYAKNLSVDFDTYNFLQIMDVVTIATDDLSLSVSSCAEALGNYKDPTNEKSLTVSEIESAIKNINNRLSIISTLLINQKVVNDSTSVGSSEAETAEYNVDILTEDINTLQSRIADYGALLEACKPQINIQASGEVIVTNNYYEQLEIYNKLQDELSIKKTRLAVWEKYKSAYQASPSTEKSNEVKNLISAVVADYNSTVDALQATIAGYNDTSVGAESIKQVKAVSAKKESSISILIFLACEVLVLVVACVGSLYVTKKKENK